MIPQRSADRLKLALQWALQAKGMSAQVPASAAPALRFIALCRGNRLRDVSSGLAPAHVLCALSKKAAIDLALSNLVDGLVIDVAGQDGVEGFIGQVRALPDLADLPLIALAPEFERQTMVELGFDAVAAASALAADAHRLGQAYRDIRRLREALRQAKREAGGGGPNGEAALLSYLDRAYAEAPPRLSLALLGAVSGDKRPAPLPYDEKVHGTLFEFLSTLTRAEDVVFGLGEGKFALVLPEVSGKEAGKAIERLRRVCRHSAFLTADGNSLTDVDFFHAIVTAADFSTAQSLWESARRSHEAVGLKLSKED